MLVIRNCANSTSIYITWMSDDQVNTGDIVYMLENYLTIFMINSILQIVSLLINSLGLVIQFYFTTRDTVDCLSNNYKAHSSILDIRYVSLSGDSIYSNAND